LWRGETNLFYAAEGIPDAMRNYIGGLVENAPAFAALLCPSINSYKRTVPGAWAPVNATWAVDNRTTAVRAIPGGRKSARIELRLTGADINPYLAMAASLAAGLDGIVRALDPPAPAVNAYAEGVPDEAAALPRSLAEATRLFRASAAARRWLGDDFVDHYAATRDWEVRQYEKAVTDWELARYLESI
jgi:glutamine synthetase